MSADDKVQRPASFPDDLASCHAMLEGVFDSLVERDKRSDQLEENVDQLSRERYGRKRERDDPEQQKLFDAPADGDPPAGRLAAAAPGGLR